MRSDIYEILDTVCDSSCKSVLATIIDVQGSAYQRAGAMMLFLEKGQQVGLLSGGCLEQDLFARVNDFLYDPNPNSTIVTYDLTGEDDLSWGQGAGCNGIIKVVVESVTSLLKEDLRKVRDLVNHGIDVTYVKRISMQGKVLDYLFCTAKGGSFGQWQGERPTIHQDECAQLLQRDQKVYFMQKIMARPRLFIYGAGVDVIPLAHLAHLTGFQVIVADWRPAFCNEIYFPFVYKTYIASPSEFAQSFSFSSSDSNVLMTHNYEKDDQLIHLLLEKKIAYFGILGSKVRAEKLLKGVRIPKWIHFPVGLAIGAEGPQEIAISIMAELIQIKARRLAVAL
ncbi:XdhC family protein [Metabacillus bambusae]|uniref:XdhC family protein n=1 Tax=Metabacillus bambusae TaxID=2795218 RepID=A0ABS3N1Q8_9BACI|nr:XdhC family protein [Metabacillus bambusae]MBO1512090.1 XdhC family protein [Metabacillus bambusae]